ncbi:MAG: nucleoside hydrolase, partial [Caldilineaceae bacterium]|nr:nucleoside hydrolase [Caldilinea sp.]MCB0147673.1 nucleoside hydrolase [Caldilineaceae bacterium]
MSRFLATDSTVSTMRVVDFRPSLWRRLAACLLAAVMLATIAVPVASAQSAPLKLIVDTDPGVDDALALTWLLSQRERPIQVLGIVSVFGNT